MPSPTAAKQAEIINRRKLVASLYLNKVDKVSQQEIADRVGVTRSTVCKDVTALKKQWREESMEDVSEHVSRELAELDRMELEVASMYQTAKKEGTAGGSTAGYWYKLRLDTKDRRIKLLGLDKLTAMTVQKMLDGEKTSDEKIIELKNAILKSLESR